MLLSLEKSALKRSEAPAGRLPAAKPLLVEGSDGFALLLANNAQAGLNVSEFVSHLPPRHAGVSTTSLRGAGALN